MDGARRRTDLLDGYETRTTIPLLVLAVAALPLLVVPAVADLSPRTASVVLAADWVIWGLFVADYGIRLYLAPDRWRFVRGNKIDLLIVVLPFLRPLRVVRSARGLRILRAALASTFIGRGTVAFGEVFTRHNLHYAVAVTVALVFAGALMVYAFESAAPGGNIESVEDALWWAAATVTTVGFGDQFPITTGGRAVGIGLMVVGLSLFAFVAGSLVSYFFDSREKEGEPTLRDVVERLERIEARLGDTPEGKDDA
ncbi:MAG TPA: ion channel [Actinomycetota bacterium]|nr:ion channel [Actinomycetota bacterium]